jgi:membrane associated rhomboid family serine protease
MKKLGEFNERQQRPIRKSSSPTVERLAAFQSAVRKSKHVSHFAKLSECGASSHRFFRVSATIAHQTIWGRFLAVDLNHILLFVAVVSPLLVLGRAWRPGEAHRGWRVASVVVLAITGLAWLFARDVAGFIGGAAWFALLFIPAVGLRKMTDLAAHGRYAAARRLAIVLRIFHPSAELRREIELFRELKSNESAGFVSTQHQYTEVRQPPFRHAPAVVTFIALNVAAFLVEISRGDSSDFITLHRLGALEPYRVVVLHEYWRLLSALFLHAGIAHLLFNLFALYVLGPGLERAIGSRRFALCYLLSGLGSSAGVVAFWMLRLTNADQVVGASGCVMGIVGAWAGFLLLHRHIPRARERLSNILLIIVIQTVFDFTTPQISTAAHVCGLISGFILGLLLSPRAGAERIISDRARVMSSTTGR